MIKNGKSADKPPKGSSGKKALKAPIGNKKDKKDTAADVTTFDASNMPEFKQLTDNEINTRFETFSRLKSRKKYDRNIADMLNVLNATYDLHVSGVKIPDETLELINEYVVDVIGNVNYYGRRQSCFGSNPNVNAIIKALSNANFKFDPKTALMIMRDDDQFIAPIMKAYNNEFTYDFIVQISPEITKDDIIKKILATQDVHIKFTDKEKTEYLVSPYSNKHLVCVLMEDPCIVITAEIVSNIALTHNIDILKSAIAMGGKLNTSVLEDTCASFVDRIEKVTFVLDNKVSPTKKAFDNIINRDTKREIYRYGSVSNVYRKHSNDPALAIDLLVRYGYVVTYDDLMNALKKKVVINNIERFNMKFDSTYFQVCAEIGMYPYKVDGTNPDIVCLVRECKKACNLTTIRDIINKYNLVPDAACMREACKHKSNLQTIKYLVSKGGKIDLECVKNMANAIRHKTLDYTIDQFIDRYNVVAKDGSVDPPIDPPIDPPVKKDKIDFDLDFDSDSDSDYEVTEDFVNNKWTTVVKAAKKVSKDSKEENGVTDVVTTTTPDNTTTTPVVPAFVSSIPKDFLPSAIVYGRIPSAIRTLLKLTAKNKEMTYVDFRAAMLQYLYTNGMIENKVIKLKEPYLYNGKDTVEMNELNEWSYSLLSAESVVEQDGTKKAKKSRAIKKDVKDDTVSEISEISNEENTQSEIVTVNDIDDEEIEEDDNSSIISEIKSRRARRATASKNKKQEDSSDAKITVGKKTSKVVKAKTTKDNEVSSDTVDLKKVVSKKSAMKKVGGKTNTKVSLKEKSGSKSEESDNDDEEENIVKKVAKK